MKKKTGDEPRWRPAKSAPKNRLILILLEECAGTYAALARWHPDPRGFCWYVPGGSEGGGWHEKCVLGWAPANVPAIPTRSRRSHQKRDTAWQDRPNQVRHDATCV